MNQDLNKRAVLTDSVLYACAVVLGEDAGEARTILFQGDREVGEALVQRWNAPAQKVYIVSGCSWIGIHGAFPSMQAAQDAVMKSFAEFTDEVITGWETVESGNFADAQFEVRKKGHYVNVFGVNVGEFAATA